MAAPPDYDAVVVGGGHNGLITAAYLAKSGLRALVLEARPIVGGTAASERFAGAMVNICNCDHITFRSTPVMDELDLGAFGLRYVEMEPAQVNMAWSGGPSWRQWSDVGRTVDELAAVLPGEVDGFRRYLRAARPAARLILAAATEPPTLPGLTRVALRRRFAGMSTVLRWSRRSAASIMRSFFAHDALRGPAMAGGPMVWGISPEQPGTGLGALTYAMRAVAGVARPVGGSGAMTEALRAAVEHHGGTVRTSAVVTAVLCERDGVRGVRLADGTEVTAPVVVSACDPRRTFVEWLEPAPSQAAATVARWKLAPDHEGYESKVDAVVDAVPRLRDVDHDLGSTVTIAPSLDEMDRAAAMLRTGGILQQPALMANVPSVVDPSVAPNGHHVFSLEVLLTPYRHPGGWPGSPEPRRWLELFAARCEPGFLESIVDWRAMTPDVYERDFHLPGGHAASFGGGPLATLRHPDPELTRYDTAVPGLYLTGAATFPGAGIWGASGRNCATVVLARAS